MSANLQAVADAAGVSLSTASRALNGRAKAFRISEATEKSVLDAAKKLGFRPNRVAQSLRAKKTGLVGVVVPDVSNPFFASIAQQVTRAVEDAGYHVLLGDSGELGEREIKLVDQLRSRRVEALVVCPVGHAFDHLAEASSSNIPVVVVDRGPLEETLVHVTSDHYSGSVAAVDCLLKAGHRRIGVLQGLPGTVPNDLRLKGIQDSLAHFGLTLDPRHVAGDHFTTESGERATTELLSDHPDLTALFAFSTPNAIGGMRALKRMGKRIPEDVSMVSFDDAPFVDCLRVPLTSVVQDVRRLGFTAGEIALQQLANGRRPERRRNVIPVQLVQRDSVAQIPVCEDGASLE